MGSEHPLPTTALQVPWGRRGYVAQPPGATKGHRPNQDSNHITTSAGVLSGSRAGAGHSVSVEGPEQGQGEGSFTDTVAMGRRVVKPLASGGLEKEG